MAGRAPRLPPAPPASLSGPNFAYQLGQTPSGPSAALSPRHRPHGNSRNDFISIFLALGSQSGMIMSSLDLGYVRQGGMASARCDFSTQYNIFTSSRLLFWLLMMKLKSIGAGGSRNRKKRSNQAVLAFFEGGGPSSSLVSSSCELSL